MISQVSTNSLMNNYVSSTKKESPKELSGSISRQGDNSKVEMLKASIEDGSYQLDLHQLATKIADELM